MKKIIIGIFAVFAFGSCKRMNADYQERFESVQKILLIAYIPGHYESIGIVQADNVIRRCFNPADPLIEPLVQRVVATLF